MPIPNKEAEEQQMMPILDVDWGQVVLNGGPPCFFVENRRFCGRAERWAGHGAEGLHSFVSFRAFFESQTPLCPVHRELHNRDALELTIGENNCVACSLNEREQLIDTLDRGTPHDNRADSVTELHKALDEYSTLLARVTALEKALRKYATQAHSYSGYHTGGAATFETCPVRSCVQVRVALSDTKGDR